MILLVNRISTSALIGDIEKKVYISDTPVRLFNTKDLAIEYCKNLGLKRSKEEGIVFKDKKPTGIIKKLELVMRGEVIVTSVYTIHEMNVASKVVKSNAKSKPKITTRKDK